MAEHSNVDVAAAAWLLLAFAGWTAEDFEDSVDPLIAQAAAEPDGWRSLFAAELPHRFGSHNGRGLRMALADQTLTEHEAWALQARATARDEAAAAGACRGVALALELLERLDSHVPAAPMGRSGATRYQRVPGPMPEQAAACTLLAAPGAPSLRDRAAA